MNMIYVVLPLSLLLAASAVLVFRWAVASGQFDDLDTPPQRILAEDLPTPESTISKEPNESHSR